MNDIPVTTSMAVVVLELDVIVGPLQEDICVALKLFPNIIKAMHGVVVVARPLGYWSLR
jgi:hypothetical protein